MILTQNVSIEGLEAMLWDKHLEDNLIICSFVKSNNPFRYTGVMKGGDTWKPMVLESRESLSKALLRAKKSKNGSFAIALIRRNPQSEKFFESKLLAEDQAFGSYVQLIEYVDGNSVVYGEKSRSLGDVGN